jgi:hypothetical protein
MVRRTAAAIALAVLTPHFVCKAEEQRNRRFATPPSSALLVSEANDRQRLLETALEQIENASTRWQRDQRDCAGLIRFLFREAVLGPGVTWKTKAGNEAFASADDLVQFNFTKIADRVSADPAASGLQTGDLLVYMRPNRPTNETWHLMMLLKPPAGLRQAPLVVYHPGDSPDSRVRAVELRDLIHAGAISEWRVPSDTFPRSGNPAFKGVYRWNGWR